MQACGHTPIWSGERVQRTNARGRHTYLPAFKHWIVEQAMLPGMSLAGLAMSNQVNANQLRRWVQLHGGRQQGSDAPRLLAVTIAAPQPAGAAPAAPSVAVPVEVELSGAIVRVRDGVEPATLRLVLSCLRGTAS